MENKLSEKQKAFCREYIIDFNATQAAIRAGYSKRGASVTGTRLLANAKIQSEIAALTQLACERNEISTDRVLSELARIAFLDPIELYDDDGRLKPLSKMSEDARRTISALEVVDKFDPHTEQNYTLTKIKVADKQTALQGIGRYLKMFVDRVEVDASDNLAEKLMAARERVRQRET